MNFTNLQETHLLLFQILVFFLSLNTLFSNDLIELSKSAITLQCKSAKDMYTNLEPTFLVKPVIEFWLMIQIFIASINLLLIACVAHFHWDQRLVKTTVRILSILQTICYVVIAFLELERYEGILEIVFYHVSRPSCYKNMPILLRRNIYFATCVLVQMMVNCGPISIVVLLSGDLYNSDKVGICCIYSENPQNVAHLFDTTYPLGPLPTYEEAMSMPLYPGELQSEQTAQPEVPDVVVQTVQEPDNNTTSDLEGEKTMTFHFVEPEEEENDDQPGPSGLPPHAFTRQDSQETIEMTRF